MKIPFLIIAVLALAAAFARTPDDALEARRYADAVLLPKEISTCNDFLWSHPIAKTGQEREQANKIDRGDILRWQQCASDFRELAKAMQTAGYGK